MQTEQVFEWYHAKIFEFVKEGLFKGLRVDHIDGLFDPKTYVQHLRAPCGENTYIIVEKILEPGEPLPTWPVQGTTGYDFLAQLNNLYTNIDSASTFTRFYNKITGSKRPIAERLFDQKANILYQHMAGELDNLYRLFLECNLADEPSLSALRPEDVKSAIGAFLTYCPVYRYYGNQYPLPVEEQEAITQVINAAKAKRPDLSGALSLLQFVQLSAQIADDTYGRNVLRFYMRCMQFTGPLMAKGVEDTLMYAFNSFVGHNEVGDSPETFGVTVDEFHRLMAERQRLWPLALNATSTHDTKRGEDVRARLNVLTTRAKEWVQQVEHWREMNKGLKVDGMPDDNDDYLIYQTLVGSYSPVEHDQYLPRLQEYIVKAIREAKRFTEWSSPNETYEEAVRKFAAALLQPGTPFWKSFMSWYETVEAAGYSNALTQLILKFTCPGVPDVYQGTASWDLSLVDPDNRRLVDYTTALRELEQLHVALDNSPELLVQHWQERENARVKLWLLHALIRWRTENAALFAEGEYIPLKVEGRWKKTIIAFARRHSDTWLLVVVSLDVQGKLSADIRGKGTAWGDTRVLLPKVAPSQWSDLISAKQGKVNSESEILLEDISTSFPFAVLQLTRQHNERGAGILLPIASLPSAHGIGDMGDAAYKFAQFLSNAGQQYWQILPLNPVSKENGFSPYSSYSAFAGNVLLIDLHALVEEELLSADEVQQASVSITNIIDYAQADIIKDRLLDVAWQRFNARVERTQAFEEFKLAQAGWLNDYALYLAIKVNNDNKPWYEWAESLKLRDELALNEFEQRQIDMIEKLKWKQFIFFTQWLNLRSYGNMRGVKLFGDLPFYVSFDSADVWAHRHLFSLDEEGNMLAVAGVPPDYFNDKGQLWGMPTYKWPAHREEQFKWWLNRIEQNLKLFDVLLFDHFRAFANYWEVESGETTAVSGKWLDGPGVEWMELLKKHFPLLTRTCSSKSQSLLYLPE